MVIPLPEQAAFAAFPLDAPACIEGGPGSGLTTALLLRAQAFYEQDRIPMLLYTGSAGFFGLRCQAREMGVRCGAITLGAFAAQLVDRLHPTQPLRVIDPEQWQMAMDDLVESHAILERKGNAELFEAARRCARERGDIMPGGLTMPGNLFAEIRRRRASAKDSDWREAIAGLTQVERELSRAGYIDDLGLYAAAASTVRERPSLAASSLANAALLIDDAHEISVAQWQMLEAIQLHARHPLSLARCRGAQFRPLLTAAAKQLDTWTLGVPNTARLSGPVKFPKGFQDRLKRHMKTDQYYTRTPVPAPKVAGSFKSLTYESGEEMTEAIAAIIAGEIADGMPAHDIAIVVRHLHVQDLVIQSIDGAGLPWETLGIGDEDSRKIWNAADSLVSLVINPRNSAALVALAGARGAQVQSHVVKIVREAHETNQRIEAVIQDKKTVTADWLRAVFDAVLMLRERGPADAAEALSQLAMSQDPGPLCRSAFAQITAICVARRNDAEWMRLQADLRSCGGGQRPGGIRIGHVEDAVSATWRSLHVAGHSKGWFPLTGADVKSERLLSVSLLSRPCERLYLHHAYRYEELGKKTVFQPSPYLGELGLVVEQTGPVEQEGREPFTPTLRPR